MEEQLKRAAPTNVYIVLSDTQYNMYEYEIKQASRTTSETAVAAHPIPCSESHIVPLHGIFVGFRCNSLEHFAGKSVEFDWCRPVAINTDHSFDLLRGRILSAIRCHIELENCKDDKEIVINQIAVVWRGSRDLPYSSPTTPLNDLDEAGFKDILTMIDTGGWLDTLMVHYSYLAVEDLENSMAEREKQEANLVGKRAAGNALFDKAIGEESDSKLKDIWPK